MEATFAIALWAVLGTLTMAAANVKIPAGTSVQVRHLDCDYCRRAEPHRPFSTPSAFNNVEFRSAELRSAGL